jgi:erythromycin esterase
MKSLTFSAILVWALIFVGTGNIATAQQPSGGQIRDLELGKPIERELAPADTHSYRITLKAGEFLRGVVDQRGIDVVVAVYSPIGEKILNIDSPNWRQGPEPFNLEAKTSGSYRIDVQSLEKDAPSGRYEVRVEEILSADQYAASLAKERSKLEAVKQWLASNAIPLRTVEAGNGFADMQPLKKLIGSAHLVSLGEATHGTREFFQLKHRMLEFLVSEMGFTIFAIEATMPESFDINEYILTGRGDPVKALAGIYVWPWDTKEVLEMIEWTRSYNADPRHARKVKFYGFDVQSAVRAAKVTLAYLRRVDPQQAKGMEKELSLLANPYTEPQFASLTKESKAAAAEAIRAVLASFDSNKKDYVKFGSADEWALARQHAQVLAQNIEMKCENLLSRVQESARDRSMADNIRWILDHEGPDVKAVIWAHNGHVAVQNQFGIDRMGMHLRRIFGSDMVVFGFAFNQGGFQAVENLFTSDRDLRTFNVDPAPVGSLDGMLASAGLRIAAIDMRTLPKDGEVAVWFSEPRLARSISANYSERYAAIGFSEDVAPKIYDALLFVEKTTAARSFDKTATSSPQQKLPAPSNTDFENGEAGKPPVNWQVPSKLRRYDFHITTSEERPYDGKRCVLINRSPGKHYGEVVGGVSQGLDATAYRGKKIRVRAAARAELSGTGNMSWFRLSVSRNALGPQAVIFDSLDKYPVTSAEWVIYEIIADVPQDADTINYGLFLVGDGSAWLDTVSVQIIEK